MLHVAGKCLRTWWKIRKPTTFGVKVLLIHPDDPAQCLIVRHSYSDSAWWGMPGGGYRPGRETPEHAGVREVSEELALTVAEAPTVLEWLELGPYGYLPTDPGSPACVHQHLDIGQGDVDWDVFFRTVAEVEFDGIAAVCVFAWEERARESSVFNLEQIRQYLAKHPGPAA